MSRGIRQNDYRSDPQHSSSSCRIYARCSRYVEIFEQLQSLVPFCTGVYSTERAARNVPHGVGAARPRRDPVAHSGPHAAHVYVASAAKCDAHILHSPTPRCRARGIELSKMFGLLVLARRPLKLRAAPLSKCTLRRMPEATVSGTVHLHGRPRARRWSRRPRRLCSRTRARPVASGRTAAGVHNASSSPPRG